MILIIYTVYIYVKKFVFSVIYLSYAFNIDADHFNILSNGSMGRTFIIHQMMSSVGLY